MRDRRDMHFKSVMIVTDVLCLSGQKRDATKMCFVGC